MYVYINMDFVGSERLQTEGTHMFLYRYVCEVHMYIHVYMKVESETLRALKGCFCHGHKCNYMHMYIYVCTYASYTRVYTYIRPMRTRTDTHTHTCIMCVCLCMRVCSSRDTGDVRRPRSAV